MAERNLRLWAHIVHPDGVISSLPVGSIVDYLTRMGHGGDRVTLRFKGMVQVVYVNVSIIRVRKRVNELIPVGLLFPDLMMEAGGDGPLVAFVFPVYLPVICDRRLTSVTKNVPCSLPEF